MLLMTVVVHITVVIGIVNVIVGSVEVVGRVEWFVFDISRVRTHASRLRQGEQMR